MDIPDKIKNSIENRLIEINHKRFSQDTIKLFLIEIREYIPNKSALREIAHFIAHPERDRGKILESVNYAYNRARVLFRQLDGKKNGKGLELDINNLPIDIYDTVIWHHTKLKPNIQKLSKFKKTFAFDNDSQTYIPKKQIRKQIIKTIQEAIGIVSLQPELTQAEIIKELISALEIIGLEKYSESISENQTEIMICILAILHQSSFKLKDGNIANAYLSSDPIVNDLEGKVYITASVKTEFSKASIGFTLIQSDVTIRESFSQSMVNMDFGYPRTDFNDKDFIDAIRNKEDSMVFFNKSSKTNITEPIALQGPGDKTPPGL